MRVSVLVPLAGEGRRADVWRWLRRRLERDVPEWEIVVGVDRTGEAFSKGRAVEFAARRSSGDVLVVHDADALVDVEYLQRAVALVIEGAPWVLPHDTVQRLSSMATARVLTNTVADSDLAGGVYRTHPAVIGGGVTVLLRQTYETVGGIDPRFTGWGGDDLAFGWALDSLVGEHVQLDAALWHLWHEPGLRRRALRPLNECLAGAYRDAYEGHDVDRMRALCAREVACA